MKQAKGVLFDLDGTLLDTLPDFVYALNQMRKQLMLDDIPASLIKPIVNFGSAEMLKRSFNIDKNHPDFNDRSQQLLSLYSSNIARTTTLFHEMDKVLTHLQVNNIPWGIVTNKPGALTKQLLKAIKLNPEPHIVVSGDTLNKSKPHPEPIWHACSAIKVKPEDCLFIGDAKTDVLASHAAGTYSLVALYGYIDDEDNPEQWNANGYIRSPVEIINWL